MRRAMVLCSMVLCSMVMLAACSSGGARTAATLPPSQPYAYPSAIVTATPALGGAVTLNGQDEGVQVNVTLLAFDEHPSIGDAPLAGQRWVAAHLRIVNVGSTTWRETPAADALLLQEGSDTNFDAWTHPVMKPSLTDEVELAKGQETDGWIAFQIPQSATVSKFFFATDAGFSHDTAEWPVG